VLETELGKDFLEWLIKVINNKTIAINTATVQIAFVFSPIDQHHIL
jgi:hypothetical protein